MNYVQRMIEFSINPGLNMYGFLIGFSLIHEVWLKSYSNEDFYVVHFSSMLYFLYYFETLTCPNTSPPSEHRAFRFLD